jgi:anti-sigma regulatory factor (Ser/Thr protein kinase)
MDVRVLLIEWDEDPMSCERKKFIDVYRKFWRPLFPQNREANFELCMHEIVKNIYDHANGKGVLKTTIMGKRIEFEAYDFGPGYTGPSPDKSFQVIRKLGTTTTPNKTNFGLGLSTVDAAFTGLRGNGYENVHLSVSTFPYFHYKGGYTTK